MPDLCFLANLTSAEWAAWVQALGSTAAIGVAIWVASSQSRAVLKRDRALEQQRKHNARQLSGAFAERLSAALVGVLYAYEPANESFFEREERKLEDLILLARSIDLSDLPAGAIHAIVRLRNIAAEAIGDLVVIKRDGYFVGIATVPAHRFQNLLQRVGEESEALLDAFDKEITARASRQ